MLETSNLARKYTLIYSFRKDTFRYKGSLNFADVIIFFEKNQRFWAKIVPLLKAIMRELCSRFFSSDFSFCKIKGYYLWKYKFDRLCVRNPASKLVQIGRKLEKWQCRHNFPKWSHRQIFWHCFVSLVKLSCLSKFHVNFITGSRVMTISFYKGLTRNPEIGNTPVWVSPIIWRLGRVRNTKLGTNASNKMLLNAAKCQGYGFYRFWVIKGKPTKGAMRDWGRGGKITFLYIYN